MLSLTGISHVVLRDDLHNTWLSTDVVVVDETCWFGSWVVDSIEFKDNYFSCFSWIM